MSDDSSVIFRVHALEQMFARGISEVEVRAVLEDDDAIEHYPDDLPYPSRLLLGWLDGRPIHVVVSYADAHTVVVVTAYEPDPNYWELGFRTRRP